jgi:hypothetical protein
MQFLANLAAAIALLVSTAVLEAEPILYATAGGGSTLVRIDVGAGTVTKIGDLGVPAADAIAISPQGKLYTVTQGWPANGVDPQLACVDLATALATPFGVNLNPEIFMGIGFSPEGTLYGVNADSGTPNQNSLYQFDLTTGAATKVGVTGGCGDIMDLAWHPDGAMYGAAWDSLYRINRNTGQAELVTKLQGLTAVMGLAIDDHGNFYVSEIVDNAPLWRVDPVTGAATAVAGVSLSYPHGLEFIPAPPLVTIRVSQVEVCWNSQSNLTYQVQYRSGLTTNLWTALGGCVRSTGAKSCISDPVVVGQPQRFYRVVLTNCVPTAAFSVTVGAGHSATNIMAKAANGDSVELLGAGQMDAGAETASLSGSYVIRNAAGNVTASGNWHSTQFLSWEPTVACTGGFLGYVSGTAIFKVRLDGIGEAYLSVTCAGCETPMGTDAVTLYVMQGQNFKEPVNNEPSGGLFGDGRYMNLFFRQ